MPSSQFEDCNRNADQKQFASRTDDRTQVNRLFYDAIRDNEMRDEAKTGGSRSFEAVQSVLTVGGSRRYQVASMKMCNRDVVVK